MPLVKDGRVAEDPWRRLADEDEVEAGQPVIVSLKRWQAERETLKGRNAPLGLWLKSDQSPAQVAEDLQHFALIALEFPKFNDGRAFSYARLLRERYGYQGEVRAVGEVLRDLLLYMHRCGFDAFAIDRDDAAARWEAALEEMSVWYQPTADRRPFALRERARAGAPTPKPTAARAAAN
jgi:uncharacterized protein (DUF934 family)